MDVFAAKTLNLGEIIAENRKKIGWTQERLAKYLGITKASISKWETGQSYPHIMLLPELASLFDISIDDLLSYESKLSNSEIERIARHLVSIREVQGIVPSLERLDYYLRRHANCPEFLANAYLAQFREFKAIAVQYANKDTLALQVRRVTPLDEDARGLEISSWVHNKEFFNANEGRDVWSFMDKALRTRYKKFIRTSYRDKMINNLLFGLLIGILIRFQIINIDSQNLLMYSPKVIPFAIGMTFGAWYLPMCFRHMDLPLIYHDLYQESAIRKSMVWRYLYLLQNGIALVASLVLGLLLVLWVGGLSIGASTFLKLALAYALIYLIYETYHVIVYYLLQPYTADLTVQNPIFSVLNWLTGILTVGVLFAKNNVILLLPTLTMALGIIWLLFLVTLKYAPKTFKLRFMEDARRTLTQQ